MSLGHQQPPCGVGGRFGGGADAIGSPDWFSLSMEKTPSPPVLGKRKNKNLKKKIREDWLWFNLEA